MKSTRPVVDSIVPSKSYYKGGRLTWHWITLKWFYRPRVEFQFKWYDLWIGAFYERQTQTWYVCPLPCVVIKIYPKHLEGIRG